MCGRRALSVLGPRAYPLASFLDYSTCQGRESIGAIGYTPLPVNLVEAGFQQIEKIKRAAHRTRPPAVAPSVEARTWRPAH